MSEAARYIQPGVVLAAVAGVCVSIYLTSVHYAAAPLVCSTQGAINCERVLSSAYGVIAGTNLPTSAAGIAWFAVAAMLGAARWSRPALPSFRTAQVAWSVAGLASVVYLVFVEIVQLGAICVWCTVAHVLVLLIFLVTVTVRAQES